MGPPDPVPLCVTVVSPPPAYAKLWTLKIDQYANGPTEPVFKFTQRIAALAVERVISVAHFEVKNVGADDKQCGDSMPSLGVATILVCRSRRMWVFPIKSIGLFRDHNTRIARNSLTSVRFGPVTIGSLKAQKTVGCRSG